MLKVNILPNVDITPIEMEKGELKSGATKEKRQRCYGKIIPKEYTLILFDFFGFTGLSNEGEMTEMDKKIIPYGVPFCFLP